MHGRDSLKFTECYLIKFTEIWRDPVNSYASNQDLNLVKSQRTTLAQFNHSNHTLHISLALRWFKFGNRDH